ncbi:Peroxidase, partial [Armadillidium vulgare]
NLVSTTNRLAQELGRLNPHWSDETIFQETRRIIVAQIQHIAYNEWLPIVIGTSTAEAYNLLPLREGFTHNYDRFLSAQIRNEFASIGFRFGHTLVEGMVRLFDKSHNNRESINLFEHFNRPGIIYRRFDELLRVLFKQPMQSFDNNIVDDLTNRLFQTDTMPFGMDLISLNTQRARDHATGTYNDLREACGVRRARTFSELRDLIRPESIEVFRRIYASVDDIDPFVAAISEASVNGAFWEPFLAQLYEIRKTSWASIICANGDDVERVQPLAFRLPGPNNEKVPCSSAEIPKLDLTAWISAPRETYGYPSS